MGVDAGAHPDPSHRGAAASAQSGVVVDPEMRPVAPYPAAPTNTLAIVAFVLAFVFTIGGIVCGHLALSQIKQTGEAGRGLAIAALVIGYTSVGFMLVLLVALLVAPLLLLGGLAAAQGVAG